MTEPESGEPAPVGDEEYPSGPGVPQPSDNEVGVEVWDIRRERQ